MQGTQEEKEVSLFRLMYYVKRAWKAIAAATLVGLAVFFAAAYFLLPKSYVAKGSAYVSYGEGRSLASVIEILNSDDFMQKIVKETDSPFTYEQLQAMLTVERANKEDKFIHVTATTSDPYVAAEACNTYLNTLKRVIPTVSEDGKTGSASPQIYAKPSAFPSSPSYLKLTALGGAAGFCVVAAIAVLRGLMDKTIKGEEDLQEAGIVTLGEIPHVDSDKSRYSH